MSNAWHWFVIIGTVGSLIGVVCLLYGNRQTSGDPTTGHEWDGIEELDNPLPLWWVGLFGGTVVFAIPFLLFFPGLGNFSGFGDWSSADQHDTTTVVNRARFAPLYAELNELSEDELHADRRAQLAGRRLFINHCSTCHGINAAGGFGFPNLRDNDWQWGGDFAAVRQTIEQGRVAIMAPWGAALGEEKVDALVQHVLRISGQAHDAGRADAGKRQYDMLCVACHGADGKGNLAFGAPNLTDSIWLYGGEPEQITFTINHGRNGNMPAHADVLDPGQIHVLAGYVTSLSEPKQSAAVGATGGAP